MATCKINYRQCISAYSQILPRSSHYNWYYIKCIVLTYMRNILFTTTCFRRISMTVETVKLWPGHTFPLCVLRPLPRRYGLGSRSWPTLGLWTTILWKIIQNHHSSKDIWPGHGFRPPKHCVLNLWYMALDPVTPPKFLGGVYYSIVATVKHYRVENLNVVSVRL